MLSLKLDPQATCGDISRLAEGKIADIEAKVADLQRIRDALREMADACPGHGPVAVCPILDILEKKELAPVLHWPYNHYPGNPNK